MSESTSKTMYEELARTMAEPSFLEDACRVDSKSLLKDISAGGHRTEDGGAFSEALVARRAAALSFVVSTLSAEGGEIADPPDTRRRHAARLARIWEGLAKLGEGAPRRYALLNASCAYELAGYQANAACLARSFLESERNGGGNELQRIAAMFLARRFVELRQECAGLVGEPDYDSVDSMPYRLGLAAAARSLSDIAGFFLSGSRDGIDVAADLLRSAEGLLASRGFYEESALLYGLRCLIGPMTARSTWRALECKRGRPLWERYMMLLARGRGGGSSASETWPSQRAAIDGGLVDSDASRIVRMPAGSGRARVVEMAILHALDRGAQGTKCVYVAPCRALVSEAAGGLLGVFPDLGFGVCAMDGAYDDDPVEDDLASCADILVTTPEKLDLMLRAHPGRLGSAALFVIDEGHAVGDGGRGLRMEMLLARLRSRYPASRFIVMSAVLSDESMREFAGWLCEKCGEGGAGGIIETGWRPTARRLARLEWPPAEDGECALVHEGSEEDHSPQVRARGVIRSEAYEHADPETGRISRPSFPSTEKGETAAELAFKYSALGPVQVYAAQPAWAVSVALKLEGRISLAAKAGRDVPYRFRTGASTRSRRAAAEWLGGDHDLTRLLGMGIAVHHGGMPGRLRDAIESDVRDGKYPVVVSTGALSRATSMPVRTLIVHSCRSCDRVSGRQMRIPAHEYWSMAGRAGRAGRETEGAVIHIVGSDMDRRDYDYYRSHRGQLDAVRSHAFQLLDELAEGRISAADLEAEVGCEALGILAEEGAGGGCEAVDRTVSATLAAAQTPEGDGRIAALRECLRGAAKKAAEMGESTARAYAGTGLSVESCRRISSYVRENRDRIAGLLSSGSDEDAVGLARIALDLADQMPEMPHRHSYGGDTGRLVEMWLGGAPAADMPGGAGHGGRDGAAQVVDGITGRDLPWAVSALIRIAAHETGADPASLPPRVRHLPGMIKYGVASPEASWAMRLGVTSRRAAMSLSAACPEGIGLAGFASWLSGIDEATLVRRHGAEEGDAARIAAATSGILPNRLVREGRGLDSVLETRPAVACTGSANAPAVGSRISPGEPLLLKRDYDALHDRNAIAVHARGTLLGYMDRGTAGYLAPLIDCGTAIEAEAAAVDDSDARREPGYNGIVRIGVRMRLAAADRPDAGCPAQPGATAGAAEPESEPPLAAGGAGLGAPTPVAAQARDR